MNTSRISPGIQLAFLYVTAALWYGVFAVAVSSGKEFLGSLPVICIFFVFIAPILFFYILLRVAFVEHVFIAKHPVVFGGAVAVTIAPICYLCFTFISFFNVI
jgi:hypothetical protein